VTIVSYARNHEDVLLDRVFPRGRPGFYVDIGAADPTIDSVTRHFYDLGWRGINVVASGSALKAMDDERPRDLNLAVSGTEAGRATLTLAELFERHVEGAIDFLSIGCSGPGGDESEVITGADWRRWRPKVVVVRATEPATFEQAIETPRLLAPTHDRWEHLLLDAGYLFAAFDGVNRLYAREEDADLASALKVPVNAMDGYTPATEVQLRRDLEILRNQQVADGVANQTLRAEYQALAAELTALRAQYEKLERALTAARTGYEEIREGVGDANARTERALAAVGETAASIDDVGAAALGVARRLSAVSRRYPKAGRSVKKALRAGLELKRSAAKSPS
jgi:hypothetical protein